MNDKKTITTIVKKADECVVYHDDGIFCSWTETKLFNFDLIKETKENADGIVILISEEEAEKFRGKHYAFDNHECWILAKPYIWMIYGDFPKAHWDAEPEEVKEVVRFLRTLQI